MTDGAISSNQWTLGMCRRRGLTGSAIGGFRRKGSRWDSAVGPRVAHRATDSPSGGGMTPRTTVCPLKSRVRRGNLSPAVLSARPIRSIPGPRRLRPICRPLCAETPEPFSPSSIQTITAGVVHWIVVRLRGRAFPRPVRAKTLAFSTDSRSLSTLTVPLMVTRMMRGKNSCWVHRQGSGYSADHRRRL